MDHLRAMLRRPALLLTFLAWAAGPAFAAGPGPAWPGRFEPGNGRTTPIYAETMTRYRWIAAATPGLAAYPFIFRDRVSAHLLWTWAAADGSMIRRTEAGRFRLILAGSGGTLFVETTCLDAGWPLFVCEDGTERRMSAPDEFTIIFDTQEFKRALPALAETAEAP